MSFAKLDNLTADIVLRRVCPLSPPSASPMTAEVATAVDAGQVSHGQSSLKQRRRRRQQHNRRYCTAHIYAIERAGWGGVSFCWKAAAAGRNGVAIAAALVVKFAREGKQADIEREAAVYEYLESVSSQATGACPTALAWPRFYGFFIGSGFTTIVLEHTGEPLTDWATLSCAER
jgi:hypothetical protein